jgi:ribose transport system substrate-binding protein
MVRKPRRTARRRRTFLKGFGSAALLGGLSGCIGGLGGGASSPEDITLGFSTHFTSGAWVSALVDGADVYAKSKGFDYNLFTTGGESQQQIEDMRQMINQDYDAIILVPFSTQDIAGVVEEATEADIPVFTLDIDAATPETQMLVSWSDEKAARTAADRLIEGLRSQNLSQDSFTVLEVRAPPGRDISRLRHEPFVNRVNEVDDVELGGTVVGDWARDVSFQNVREWINSNEEPDAVYSANFAMGLGAVQALDELGLRYPKDHEDHVVAVQLDGSSQTHEWINQGFIDRAIDQPVHYYGPIAVEYIERYVTGDGSAELPQSGDEVTADDISIEPTEYQGNTLWQDPIWAPASVGESFGHTHFVTNFVEVTPDNADSPNLWGNNWG